MKLTKRTVAALPMPKEGRTTYQDSEDGFLHVVVTPTVKTWRYIRKVNGRVVFITLGRFPSMTPEQAREESKKTSACYVMGRDPQSERKAARKVVTWGDLFGWYLETHAKPHKKTWEEDVRQDALYCGAWKSRSWKTITPDMVTRWHKQIGKRAKFAADRALALVRTVFNKALGADLIQGRNPASGTRMFNPTCAAYSRDRFLQADELQRLFKALEKHPEQDMADFFKLCIFTGARRGNVQAMRWADFDRERLLWTIPGTESKNKEPMKIPLLTPAAEILNRRWEKRRSDVWVFPSAKRNGKTPHLAEPKKAWKSLCEKADLRDVRIHDLRRTLGSWQAICGASMAIIGKSLGHKDTKATEVYARLSLDPVRQSMDAAVTKMLEAANSKPKTKAKK